MQNAIQKFRQSSIVFEKSGILPETLKTLPSSNYPTVQYFFPETSRTFSIYHCLKNGVWNFFYLDLELFAKLTWFLHTRFLHFINNSRSKQKKKNPPHTFVVITK